MQKQILYTLKPLSDTEYDLTAGYKDGTGRKLDAHLRREMDGCQLKWILDIFDSAIMTTSTAHLASVQINGWYTNPEWQDVFEELKGRL